MTIRLLWPRISLLVLPLLTVAGRMFLTTTHEHPFRRQILELSRIKIGDVEWPWTA